MGAKNKLKEIELDQDLLNEKTTRLSLKGETTAVVRSQTVAFNLMKIFEEADILIKVYKKMTPELLEFLAGGSGALFADTYVGLEAVRYVSEKDNQKIPVIFLKDPNDTFFDTDKLKSIGPRVIGVYDEMISMDHLIEIVKLANRGYFDQEVTFMESKKKEK